MNSGSTCAPSPRPSIPLAVADDSSETIRYLTGGVLLRLNRDTQKLEPELATSWTVSKDGRQITFILRPTIYFSDGTPFTAQDVKYTMDQLMNPELHSPTADSFRSGDGKVECTVLAPGKVAIRFPAPVAGLERLFDQVAIVSVAVCPTRRRRPSALTMFPPTSPDRTSICARTRTTGSTMPRGASCRTSAPSSWRSNPTATSN